MNTARRPAPVATSCRPLSRLEADSPSRAPDASCCGQQLGGPSTRTISATRGRRRRRACCEGGNPRRRGCKGPVDPAAARALPADDLGRAGLASAETWRPTGVKPSLEGGGGLALASPTSGHCEARPPRSRLEKLYLAPPGAGGMSPRTRRKRTVCTLFETAQPPCSLTSPGASVGARPCRGRTPATTRHPSVRMRRGGSARRPPHRFNTFWGSLDL
jgi:hypothetical protein